MHDRNNRGRSFRSSQSFNVSATPGGERVKHLAGIVNEFPQKRIVVIGDAIADQFVHGQISRVSREAPVLILSHEHTETTPRAPGNRAANLAALRAKVALVSVAAD